jgi:hypothetical protein
LSTADSSCSISVSSRKRDRWMNAIIWLFWKINKFWNFENSQEFAYDSCHASNATRIFLTPKDSSGGMRRCEYAQWDL